MKIDDTYAVEAAFTAACSIACADLPNAMFTQARELAYNVLAEVILRERDDLTRDQALNRARRMALRLDGSGTYTRDEIRSAYAMAIQ